MPGRGCRARTPAPRSAIYAYKVRGPSACSMPSGKMRLAKSGATDVDATGVRTRTRTRGSCPDESIAVVASDAG